MPLTYEQRRDAWRWCCAALDRLNSLHPNLKTKRATDAALDLLLGAACAWEISGQTDLAAWARGIAFIVSVRDGRELASVCENLRAFNELT